MIHILKGFLSKFGVDRAIFYTSSARIIQALGGLVTIFLIASFMTKEEQGFYYTFASVLAIQIFFELGLGGIIVQFVAHEMAHLHFKNPDKIEGKADNLSRLSSIMHFCFKWYALFAGMLLVSLLTVGYLFFTKYGGNNPSVEWKIPWLIVALGGSLNLLISPWMAVLQGMNKVKEMARLALFQQLVVLAITWISLILGAKLYIAAINSMTSLLVLTLLYSRTSYPRLLLNLYKQKVIEKISYRHEIFPYQWRIALSWISGYFIFQMFNPVIFAFNGAVAAGQMGMTLVAINSILSLILSWTSTKIPIWSTFIANKDFQKLDQSFNKVLRDSTIVGIICIIAFIIVLVGIDKFQLSIANRFLPIWLSVLLAVTVPLNNIVNSWATYLRCHKKEPFLFQAIIIGLLCAISTILTAKFFGVSGVVIGYTLIIVFISLPLSYHIFKTKKNTWHVQKKASYNCNPNL